MGLMDSVNDFMDPNKLEISENIFGDSNQLTKAELHAYESPEQNAAEITELKTVFFLNPKSVQITKEVKTEQSDSANRQPQGRVTLTYPTTLTLGELWFDTYDTRENVRSLYIEKLERLLDPWPETHHVPAVKLVWGEFIHEEHQSTQYTFYVKKVQVDYTMFMPNGRPVRAKVNLTLEQARPREQQLEEDPFQSPDHAKIYTVRRGDTLQGIALQEYDDPREWRRIAVTNDIDDPLNIAPGVKLLVPPILK